MVVRFIQKAGVKFLKILNVFFIRKAKKIKFLHKLSNLFFFSTGK